MKRETAEQRGRRLERARIVRIIKREMVGSVPHTWYHPRHNLSVIIKCIEKAK